MTWYGKLIHELKKRKVIQLCEAFVIKKNLFLYHSYIGNNYLHDLDKKTFINYKIKEFYAFMLTK